jgi:Flp pilus assembly protein TadG
MRALLQRLWRDTGGASLIEFAIAAPVMITLYMMAFVLSDAVACNRKVSVATRELTDVTTRFTVLKSADLDNVLAAIAQVMSPYATDKSHAVLRISEVQVLDLTHAKVIWTRTNADTNSIAVGDTVTLPTGMVTATMLPNATGTPVTVGAYFIMGEVSYNYTPAVTYNGMGTLKFGDRIFLVPRSSTNIPLQS